ncbi:MAG: ankyrin repeat domain-containing protein [Kordiimonadaceae bacterium]|nr:ankyrin repeat domain-containing protein [Kordiimonadaceae bacterium]MBO6568066.1 ankyrin repeat domain-containing protein [Kordiimonadaceae bacterium]MBO6964204.1 ankyrin repeat domain-containing protein [Kordiimonadaceae bacterium]
MRLIHTLALLICILSLPLSARDNTALFKAVADNSPRDALTALEAGADANAINEKGASPLFEAMRAQAVDVARVLIAKGANVNFVNEQNIGATPLMMAAAYNNGELVNLLLSNDADVNLADSNGDPAINWAAYYGYTDIAEQLLTAGANTEQVGHGNPRQIAMRRGHQDFVRLMARRADIQLPSPNTALLIDAIEAQNTGALIDALAIGASANAKDFTGRPVLGMAARTGNVELVKRLLEAGGVVDAPDEIGFTPLMEAARDGKIEVVRFLLAEGANPNHASEASALFLTPMHMAGLSGSADMVQLLADAGADIDPVGREGGTPLMWAMSESKLEATIRLLDLGSDFNHKNSYGFSAADFARQMNNAELLQKMGLRTEP